MPSYRFVRGGHRGDQCLFPYIDVLPLTELVRFAYFSFYFICHGTHSNFDLLVVSGGRLTIYVSSVPLDHQFIPSLYFIPPLYL